MRVKAGFGRFDFQVRVVLVLVALFLAALDVLNLTMLDRAREALGAAEERRIGVQAVAAVEALGRDDLHAVFSSGTAALSVPERDVRLRRAALRFGFSRIALLEPTAGTIPAKIRSALDLSPSAARVLAPSDSAAREMTAYVPIAGPGGGVVGIVELIAATPELAALNRNFRLMVRTQLVGVVLIGVVVLLFANWVSRPYRRLAAAAGEAGWKGSGRGRRAEPDELVSAFRAMVAKLKEQDEALRGIDPEGANLGVLVRFASGAALRMPTAVLVLDRQSRVAAMNAAAAALLGCPERDPRGIELGSLPRAVRGLERLVAGCLERGAAASREVLEIRTEDGRTGHVGVSVTPASGPGAEVAGALVLMSDLTEIGQLQEQVRLRESLAGVGRLSAGIAHEVRNALGTILGYARMLEKQPDPRVRAPVKEILKEVDALREVLDEFLAYARPPEPTRLPVDIGLLVRRCAAAAPDSIDVEIRGEFGKVLGDEGLLRRMLGNLLQNAADGGSEARRRVRVVVTGRRHPAGRSLQVDVEDDGPGIPPELRAQVFVPFFTTRARGTGLGLALVQRTIVDLGGVVDALEGPRGGALFRIRLPLVAIETESAPNLAGETRA